MADEDIVLLLQLVRDEPVLLKLHALSVPKLQMKTFGESIGGFLIGDNRSTACRKVR